MEWRMRLNQIKYRRRPGRTTTLNSQTLLLDRVEGTAKSHRQYKILMDLMPQTHLDSHLRVQDQLRSQSQKRTERILPLIKTKMVRKALATM